LPKPSTLNPQTLNSPKPLKALLAASGNPLLDLVVVGHVVYYCLWKMEREKEREKQGGGERKRERERKRKKEIKREKERE
jgi:hypothetical protein